MRLLALDTTGERLSVALLDGDKVRARRARPSKEQDEQLPGEAAKLLEAAGLRKKDLDAVVAPTGPGRFTGIRVGLTFAGVLAKAIGKPAVGVSWLEACAWREPDAESILAILPGWKGEFFFQAFLGGREGPRSKHPPRWSTPAELRASVERDLGGGKPHVVGPGALEATKLGLRAASVSGQAPLGASDLLKPGRARLAAKQLEEFAPLYLKPAHYER